MKARLLKTKVVYMHESTKGIYMLGLKSPYLSQEAGVGQFVNIRVRDNSVFLRRPFSIYKIEKDIIYILFQVKGRATKSLSYYKKGEFVDLIGPLGNKFDYQEFSRANVQVLIGGGMGVVPLVFLAQKLNQNVSQKLAFLGAQNKTKLVGKKELQKYGFVVYTATLDGSAGEKKDVVSLLRQQIRTLAKKGKVVVFGCGPYEMARNLQRELKKYEIKSWFSFETIVACGLGLCRGCAIDTHSGYKLLCQDGPVFNLAEVRFNLNGGGIK